MQEVIVRVSKILGLDRNLSFSKYFKIKYDWFQKLNLYVYIGTIKTMYDSCRFERSLNIDSHPAWCAVFSQKDLEVNISMILIMSQLLFTD